MEDILASIRRILSEDDGNAVRKPADSSAAQPMIEEVLALDESMLVREPSVPFSPAQSSVAVLGSFMSASTQPDAPSNLPSPLQPSSAVAPAPPEAAVAPVSEIDVKTPSSFTPPAPVVVPPPVAHDEAESASLVAPEAASAAAASLGTLLRSLSVERQTPVYHGGPSLEDIVRDEMRPMLKEWLDNNLPGMVERIVCNEIVRMAGRAAL
jgi:cell pole-organizing protein PopZ